MTLADVAAVVGGTLHDADPATLVTAPLRYESSRVVPGGLFAAFAGLHRDGHDLAPAVVAAGAAAVLAARPVGVPAVVVDDVLRACRALADGVLTRLPGLHRVAVTGSSGKTTTKDMIGHVLRRLGPTVAPPGNRNNELGVPETVLQAGHGTRYLVTELGARRVGDVAALARLVRPHVGVVVGVGSAHLGVFGSRAAVARAKGELPAALPATGWAVLNADDPAVAAMAGRTRARVLTFGRHPGARVRADRVVLDDRARARFRLHTPDGTAPVALRLPGEHFVTAALAAAAAASVYTSDPALVADALGSFTPVSPGRMRVSDHGGVTVLDDAYNANPESLAAGLRTLAAVAGGRRRAVAVLGQMNELGADAPAAHRAAGRLAARLGVAVVLAVGNADARRLAVAAGREGVAAGHVPDAAAAAQRAVRLLRPGDVVLVKGSNGVGLARVAEAVRAGPRAVAA